MKVYSYPLRYLKKWNFDNLKTKNNMNLENKNSQ